MQKSYFYMWGGTVKNRKNIAFSLVLLLVMALICGIGFNKEFIATSAKPDRQQVVLIDAGHGGLTNTTN